MDFSGRHFPKDLILQTIRFMKSSGQIDVEAMARILEDHVKQRFWSDEEEGLNQEKVVQSELDIVH